jgi:hypothetical protein
VILARYLTAVAFVDREPSVSIRVRVDLDLPHVPMPYALQLRGLGQADLILSLLRLNTARSIALVERILGRPITHCPGVHLAWRVNGRPLARRSPVIVAVVPNPRKPNTTAHVRFAHAFACGRTLEQAMARGARKRDVRGALRRGWITVETLS